MLWLVIGIILLIIIAVVLFLILKKILKVIIILIGIIIIVLIVGGFFVYKDARDIQENFETSPNLFLFKNNGNIIAGMQMIPEQEPSLLDISSISEYDSLYQENNLDEIKKDNYKLIIFNEKSFDSVQEIQINEYTYTKEFAFELLNSDTPVDDYINYYLTKQGIPEENKELMKQQIKTDFKYTDTEFKGRVFATMFQDRIDAEGPIFIFKQYKSGNAVVYKETAVFRMIGLIPSSFLKNMIQKTTSAVKEQLNKTQ